MLSRIVWHALAGPRQRSRASRLVAAQMSQVFQPHRSWVHVGIGSSCCACAVFPHFYICLCCPASHKCAIVSPGQAPEPRPKHSMARELAWLEADAALPRREQLRWKGLSVPTSPPPVRSGSLTKGVVSKPPSFLFVPDSQLVRPRDAAKVRHLVVMQFVLHLRVNDCGVPVAHAHLISPMRGISRPGKL